MEIMKHRLANLEIIDVCEKPHYIRVDAKTERNLTTCPHCHSNRIDKHGLYQERLVDAPINNKKVLVFVRKGRYKCNHCRRTFLDPVHCKYRHLRMTRLAAYEIHQRKGKCSISKIARFIGVDGKTIMNTFFN